jgi:hypothetical protein
MMRQPAREFGHSEEPIQKWEIWSDGRRRSRTICVRLWGDAELSIAARRVGSDGRMAELETFSCDAEHLPKLIQCLTRALAVANKHGLIGTRPND